MTLRGSDVIGRFGGDEFAVIMWARRRAARLQRCLVFTNGFTQLRLSCAPQVDLRISVGVAPLTSETEHYREWLKSADMALYKAKNSGRNRTEAAA